MNINELTLGQMKEIQSMCNNYSPDILSAYKSLVGNNVLVRTVTMIYTGELFKETKNELCLAHAAWIADTGRWADNLKSCEFNEVEPYLNDVIINKGAILDVTMIETLPREQK